MGSDESLCTWFRCPDRLVEAAGGSWRCAAVCPAAGSIAGSGQSSRSSCGHSCASRSAELLSSIALDSNADADAPCGSAAHYLVEPLGLAGVYCDVPRDFTGHKQRLHKPYVCSSTCNRWLSNSFVGTVSVAIVWRAMAANALARRCVETRWVHFGEGRHTSSCFATSWLALRCASSLVARPKFSSRRGAGAEPWNDVACDRRFEAISSARRLSLQCYHSACSGAHIPELGASVAGWAAHAVVGAVAVAAAAPVAAAGRPGTGSVKC